MYMLLFRWSSIATPVAAQEGRQLSLCQDCKGVVSQVINIYHFQHIPVCREVFISTYIVFVALIVLKSLSAPGDSRMDELSSKGTAAVGLLCQLE